MRRHQFSRNLRATDLKNIYPNLVTASSFHPSISTAHTGRIIEHYIPLGPRGSGVVWMNNVYVAQPPRVCYSLINSEQRLGASA